jgi:hypothetical protein
MLPPSCERVINILEGQGKVTVILHLLSAGWGQKFSGVLRALCAWSDSCPSSGEAHSNWRTVLVILVRSW